MPLEVGQNFKRDIPDSELVVIPHCGHIPLEEEPRHPAGDYGFLKTMNYASVCILTLGD